MMVQYYTESQQFEVSGRRSAVPNVTSSPDWKGHWQRQMQVEMPPAPNNNNNDNDDFVNYLGRQNLGRQSTELCLQHQP
jgi:hypothetical protein